MEFMQSILVGMAGLCRLWVQMTGFESVPWHLGTTMRRQIPWPLWASVSQSGNWELYHASWCEIWDNVCKAPGGHLAGDEKMVSTQYHQSLYGIPGLCGEDLRDAVRGEWQGLRLRVHTQYPAILILESLRVPVKKKKKKESHPLLGGFG